MLRRQRGRARESGQVLVLALAFFALLAVLGGATLGFMSTTQLQHAKDETQTAQRAVVEGAAAFAFSDLSRPFAANCTGNTAPSGVVSGSARTPTGETLGYTVTACYPGGSNPSSGGGFSCFLCLLTTTDSTHYAFIGNKSAITITAPTGVPPSTYLGAIINGNIQITGGGGGICSRLPTDGPSTCSLKVGVAGTIYPNPIAGGTDPGSQAAAVSAISDPFANTFQAPSLSGFTTYSANPCGGSDTSGGSCGAGATANPGFYQDINISGGTLTLNPGVYVVTRSLQTSGGGSIVSSTGPNTGVTIFLTCNTGTPSYNPAACTSTTPATAATAACPPPATEAFALFSGSAASTVTLTAPASGPYAGLVVFADPKNSGSICTSGNGTLTLNGAVYGKQLGLNIQGNGTNNILANVVVGAINIHVSSTSNGLRLGVGAAVFSPISCEVYDASLTGQLKSGGPIYKGRVVFQTACSGAGGPSIISLSYSP